MNTRKTARIILLVLCFLYAIRSDAQYVYSKGGTFVYDEIGMAVGIQTTLKTTTTLVIDNKLTISGIYSISYKNASSLPEESNSKVSMLMLPGDLPQQITENIGIMIGQVIPSSNKKVRTVIRGGICLGIVAKPVDITSANSNYEYSPNDEVYNFKMNGNSYNYTMMAQNANGIIINPVSEFLVSKYFGVSTGIYANINKVSSTFGLDVNVLLGKCRRRVYLRI